MRKLKKNLNCWFWWIIQIAPVLFLLALHFVDFAQVTTLIGDGTRFGLFGRFFVDFFEHFQVTLGMYPLMLISLIDWALTVTIAKIIYVTFTIFTTWLYDLFDWRDKFD